MDSLVVERMFAHAHVEFVELRAAVSRALDAKDAEIERLRAHPVFARATGYHVDPASNTLTIDFSEDGAAQKAFDALPPNQLEQGEG